MTWLELRPVEERYPIRPPLRDPDEPKPKMPRRERSDPWQVRRHTYLNRKWRAAAAKVA
jgi:hypothetical protein